MRFKTHFNYVIATHRDIWMLLVNKMSGSLNKVKLLPDFVDGSTLPLPLLDVDKPTSSALVGLVLPHRLDALLEEGVVATGQQLRDFLDVVEDGPEVFDGVERHHLEKKTKMFQIFTGIANSLGLKYRTYISSVNSLEMWSPLFGFPPSLCFGRSWSTTKSRCSPADVWWSFRDWQCTQFPFGRPNKKRLVKNCSAIEE